MVYSDFSIEQLKQRLFVKAMKNSTPKKYAGDMLEAAEVIQQLQARIKKLITRPSNTIFNVPQRINSDSELFSELFAGQPSELPCCSDSIAHHM